MSMGSGEGSSCAARRLIVISAERVPGVVLEEVLRRYGYPEVGRLGNGVEALAQLDEDCDVVLVEGEIRGRPGPELVAELTALHPSMRLVVVAPYGSVEAALAYLRAGASEYCAVPCDDLRNFHARLRIALDGPPRAASTELDAESIPADLGEALRRLRQMGVSRADDDAAVAVGHHPVTRRGGDRRR